MSSPLLCMAGREHWLGFLWSRWGCRWWRCVTSRQVSPGLSVWSSGILRTPDSAGDWQGDETHKTCDHMIYSHWTSECPVCFHLFPQVVAVPYILFKSIKYKSVHFCLCMTVSLSLWSTHHHTTVQAVHLESTVARQLHRKGKHTVSYLMTEGKDLVSLPFHTGSRNGMKSPSISKMYNGKASIHVKQHLEQTIHQP